MENKKIGIVIDQDFASKNVPPYPKPAFFSFETPLRIKVILDYFEKIKLFENQCIFKLEPKAIEDNVLMLGHSKYHINTIKRLSKFGSALLGDELYITKDTFNLAKKAVGGAIRAVESVLNREINYSFAIVRPPGHHALREKASGLCIFNNIAITILYLREMLDYDKKIAIIDIDDHFGDGLVQYFYDDPSVLYMSIHEFDFLEGDLGFINELGDGEGIGKSINFPVPSGIEDDEFLEFLDLINPILNEFSPDLIIVAAGFDMHYSDPIGNCLLTTYSYYKFTEQILKMAEEVCEGKLAFILEGGYSLIALPYCVQSILNALLRIKYERPEFEVMDFLGESNKEDIKKIKLLLKKLLKEHWNSLNK